MPLRIFQQFQNLVQRFAQRSYVIHINYQTFPLKEKKVLRKELFHKYFCDIETFL